MSVVGETADGADTTWAYVTVKRIRDGYTWSIGSSPNVTLAELRQAMENALEIDRELRQRLGV